MQSGSLTLNGASDHDLIEVLKAKEGHEDIFQFNPQQMSTQGVNEAGRTVFKYNNLELSWSRPEGLKIILDVLQRLLESPAGP